MSRSLGGRCVTSLSPMRMRALGHGLQAGQRPQRRRLPAAGRADQDEELAVGDVEVECVHRGPLGTGVLHGRVVVDDPGHEASSPLPWSCQPVLVRGECAGRRGVEARVQSNLGTVLCRTPQEFALPTTSVMQW